MPQLVQLDFLPTYQDTVLLPPFVLVLLTQFYEYYSPLADVSFIGMDMRDYDVNQFMLFHNDLHQVTQLIRRYLERVSSIEPTDPLIPIQETISRYQNLIELFRHGENIFDCIQSITNHMEQAAIFGGNDQFNDSYHVLVADSERLRLTLNVLIRVSRRLENIIVDEYPQFVILPVQWFE